MEKEINVNKFQYLMVCVWYKMHVSGEVVYTVRGYSSFQHTKWLDY